MTNPKQPEPTPSDEALAREATRQIQDNHQTMPKPSTERVQEAVLSALTRARASDRAEIERLREALALLYEAELNEMVSRGLPLEWQPGCAMDVARIALGRRARTLLQESTDAER